MPKRAPTHRMPRDTPARDDRPNSHQRGYDERWRRFRKWFLARNPICVRCGHPATEVDHIVPLVRGGGHCEIQNSQALCKSCHSKKTAREGRNTY